MRKDQSEAVLCQCGAADLLIPTSQSSSQCVFEDSATARGARAAMFQPSQNSKEKTKNKKRLNYSKNHVLVYQEGVKQ